MAGIDYSSLQSPPPARAVAAWRDSVRTEDARAGRHGAASGGPSLQAPAWVGMVAIFAGLLCLLFAVTGIWMVLDGDGSFGLVVTAVALAVTCAGLWWVLRRRIRKVADGWEEPYQLMAFANDNGFDAAPVTDPADLPGRIFGRGLAGNRVRHDLVAWTQGGRQCHVATESWHTGNSAGGGPPEDAGSCRYLAVLLADGPLPRLEIDSAGRVTADPAADDLAAEQLAATVLTPQVRAVLTHPAAPWEAEVAGGWFFAYQPGDSSPLEIAVWERTFALVDALPPYPVPAPA